MPNTTTPSLATCIEYAAKDKALVKEFCRLSGLRNPATITPLERQIDKACNYNADSEFCAAFIAFVTECIYLPIMTEK